MKNFDINCSSPISCGISLMPMREVYQQMYDDIATAHVALNTATSAKTIQHILNEIYIYPIDDRVSESIRSIFTNIAGNICIMLTNDYTRAQLSRDLVVLLNALLKAVSEEDHTEKVESARNFFLFMAKNAHDFVDWAEIIKQKQ